MINDRQTSLRLPTDLLDRAEALVAAVKADPQYRYVPRMGSAFVLRLAIEAGLDALQARYEAPPPAQTRKAKPR